MPRTAIIAVHGVGSPPQFETARNLADLLVQHGAAARGDPTSATITYTGFAEQHITIPTAPVAIPTKSAAPAATANAPRTVTERLLDFTPGDRDRTTFAADDRTAQMDVDVAFMRDQLEPYTQTSPREPYATIELVGERVDSQVREELHVFEMYWADLSRLGTGAVAILGALYQLVLHIAHLGRKTLDLAAQAAALGPVPAESARAWKRLADAHDRAVRLFTVAVPAATLLMLACVALFAPDAVAPGMPRLVTGTVILDIGLITLLGVWFYVNDGATSGATRFVFTLLALVAAGAAFVVWPPAWLGGPDLLGTIVLRAASVLLVIGAYWYFLKTYDRYAAGALSWGSAGFVVTFVVGLLYAPRFVGAMDPSKSEQLRFVAFGAFQVSYVVLMVVWLLIWFAALTAYVQSWRTRRAMRRAAAGSPGAVDAQQRGERAMWTAQVTLGATLFGFVLTALVSYEVLAYLATKLEARVSLFPSIAPGIAPPTLFSRLVPGVAACPPDAHANMLRCSENVFSAIVAQSGTAGLPMGIAAALLTLLLVSPFITLIAVTAIRRPKSQVTYAENVGNWLTDGLEWIHTAGSLLVFLLVVALSVGLAAAALEMIRGAADLPIDSVHIPLFNLNWTITILKSLAVVVVGAGALGGAFHRVQTAMLKARPAIGIMLDIDNYLRQSPANATPRARIAERYASLLRYILNRRDTDGQPFFSRIVIVSHSQGTVITADFLRFLTVAGVTEPDVTSVDLRVVTMGSPLRQLYAANFPHLYDWIDRTDWLAPGTRPDDDTAFDVRGIVAPVRVSSSGAAGHTLAQRSPSPSWLRASIWVNLFTSGDYVGRPLWQTQDTGGIWAFQSFQNAVLGPGRRERCLGDGTHTRYWTSADVSAEIDEQLRRASAPHLSSPVPTYRGAAAAAAPSRPIGSS